MNIVRKVVSEYKETIKYLSREIEDRNKSNKAILAENESFKEDSINKTVTISRCTETVRSARDWMGTIRREGEESKISMDRMKKEHKKELETREAEMKRVETEKMVQEEIITGP